MSESIGRVRLCHPDFDDADRRRIDEVLSTGMLVQGRFVGEFEDAMADALGVEAVACNSGTSALHLAVLALGIGPGDEVIVPAFTWPSTAHVIVQAGAVPVFVDIDPDSLALDPGQLDAVASERTAAVMPVHLFGIPAPIHPIMAWAAARDVDVIEDAACALGTRCGDRAAGTVGRLGCFSFHPRKILTTGEGGVVVTADPELAERVRVLRNHGQQRIDGEVRFVEPGLNYRMSELSGALGVGQMQRLDEVLRVRRELGGLYLDALDSVAGIRVPGGLRDPGTVLQSLVVDVGSEDRRTRLREALAGADIETTIGTYAVTEQPLYTGRFGVDPSDFPVASAAMRQLMSLPLHHRMTSADVARVVDALAAVA